jgi:hypothetical protein
MLAVTVRVGSATEPVRRLEAPVHLSTVERGTLPGRDAELVALVSERMTRLDAETIDDALVTGTAPWVGATLVELASCELLLYAKVGTTWWSVHLADTDSGCAIPSAGEAEVWSEVSASGPTFIRDGTLEVALATRFHSGGRTTTWHTTVMCDVDGTGVPTCTHALVK